MPGGFWYYAQEDPAYLAVVDTDGTEWSAGDLLARCTFPPPASTVTCAFSGGPDSSALVALAVAADLDVTAIHVHHGTRDDAEALWDEVGQVLAPMGLRLSEEKTRVCHIDEGFDFLG